MKLYTVCENKNWRMRYAHIEYTDRAGHPAGVCADAVCMGVGHTADTVRLVCKITCKLTCKINIYLPSLYPVRK